MYVALTGTYAKKIPYYRWDSAHAFSTKKIYLNLLKPAEELEVEYDFKFLTEDEAQPKDGYFWFECGKILEITDMGKPSMFLVENKLMDTPVYKQGGVRICH